MLHLIPWRKKNTERSHRSTEVHQDPDALFDRLFRRWMEPVDVESGMRLFGGLTFDDRADEVVVWVDVPGFTPEQLDVIASGNGIVISANQCHQKGRGARAKTTEMRTFRRNITIPDGVDPDAIEAKYRNGVLEIHMAKTERAKPKKIPIQT